jgi:hypothetical protein
MTECESDMMNNSRPKKVSMFMNTHIVIVVSLIRKIFIAVSLASQVEPSIDDRRIPLIAVDHRSNDALVRHVLRVPRPCVLLPGLQNIIYRFDDDFELLAGPYRCGICLSGQG